MEGQRHNMAVLLSSLLLLIIVSTAQGYACYDALPNCNMFQDYACRAPYIGWALNNCKSRCNLCNYLPQGNGDCTDVKPNCADFMKNYNNFCNGEFKVFAQNSCRWTCQYCSLGNQPMMMSSMSMLKVVTKSIPDLASPPCRDRLHNCDAFPDSVCELPDWSVTNCPKRCNLCEKAPLTCVDKVERCHPVVCNGYFADWARQYCPVTCKLCGTPEPLTLAINTPELLTLTIKTPESPTPTIETPELATSAIEAPESPTPDLPTPKTQTLGLWAPKIKTTELPTSTIKTPKLPTPTIKTRELPTSIIKARALSTSTIKTPKSPTSTIKTPELPTSTIKTRELPTSTIKTPKSPTTTIKTRELQTSTTKTPELPTQTIKTRESSTSTIKTPKSPTSTIKTPKSPTPTIKTRKLPTSTTKTPELPTQTIKTRELQTSTIKARELPTPTTKTPEPPTSTIPVTPLIPRVNWEMRSLFPPTCEDRTGAGCNSVPDSKCLDKMWAIPNCKKRCNICGNVAEPCVNNDKADCSAFGSSVLCTGYFRYWAKQYCPLACGYCSPKTSAKQKRSVDKGSAVAKTMSVKYPDSGSDRCSYNGKTYQSGESWVEDCKWRCTCGQDSCIGICWDWDFGETGCYLKPPGPGKCCPTPQCPAEVKLNYPEDYVEE